MAEQTGEPMTMLEQIDQVYACAAECEIWDQPVEHPTARAFVFAATGFLRGLGEAADSELWRSSAALLRRCRRFVCTVPLPFDHPLLQFEAAADQLKATIARLEGVADSGHVERLRAVVPSLRGLAADSGDPLGDCTREFLTLEDPRDGFVVLSDRRFTDAVAEVMALNGVEVRIGTHADLLGHDIYASAVVVGSPTWTHPGLLNAPRTENLALVHYGFFREDPEVAPLLFGPAASTNVTRPIKKSKPFRCGAPETPGLKWQPMEPADEASLLTAEECSPSEEIRASFPRYPSTGGHGGVPDQVEAHAAVLADGSHVLLPTDLDARVLSLRAEDLPDVQVEQVPASSVSRGDYLALRNRPHHQDLMDRADAILGPDAASLRVTQSEWKRWLWERTKQHPRGIRGVADELRSRGAVTANVGYWVSDWCIRPRSKEDFAVVLRYLAADADVDSVWERLRRIDSAHRSAGQRYADDLQRALTPDRVGRLVAAGWCTVRLTGSDSETLVARIDYILSDTLQVPLNALCRLRTTEDSR
ncbi:hypothetical protein OG258_22050 [Streptomyces mirabilis]|uniref:hypothetical protein n=1 Tax=Streptomyces mirabilis TaxID=68239 RepID=UPI002E2AA308|nr:hypothetical protein [Streptomyces mirabilis]